MAQLVKDLTLSVRMQVQSLAFLSGLRIQCCHGCGVGLSCSTKLSPSPATSVCCRFSPKKKRKKKKKADRTLCFSVSVQSITINPDSREKKERSKRGKRVMAVVRSRYKVKMNKTNNQGRSSQYSVIICVGKESIRQWLCVYI